MFLCYFLRLLSPLLLNLMSLHFMATFALLLTCGRKKRVMPIVDSVLGVSGGKGERCHLKSPLSPPPPPPP